MNNETAALLEKHFDTAFAAPDGIKKLRELILTLAMQGKLVPQDPTDRPASELLKAIEAEKKRLMKEGKIKKPKLLPEIQSVEIPYEIPFGWQWVRLGNISTKLTDGSHNPPKDACSGYPMLSSQNVNFGRIDFSNPSRYVDESDFQTENKRTNIFPDDVLLTIVASLGRSAVVPVDAPKFVLQRSVAVISTPINSDFLCRYLGAPLCINYYLEHGKGTAQKGIYLGQLNNMLIALPPLEEQHRIVAEIDRLMSRCDELEKLRTDRNQKRTTVHTAAIDRLLTAKDDRDFSLAWSFITQHFSELYSVKENVTELRKVILQLAVMGKLVPQDPNDEPASELLKAIELAKKKFIQEGKIKDTKISFTIDSIDIPSKIPDMWKWVRIENICEVIVDCPHSTPKFIPSGIICLDTNSFKNGNINQHKLRYVSEETYLDRISRLSPQVGDIIFAREGSVGESVIVPEGMKCCLGQRVMLFRPAKGIFSRYLQLSISNPLFLTRLLSVYKGIGAKHVNVKDMRNALVPLPPLSEQYRIVEKIDRLMEFCDRLEASIEATKLKQTDLLNAVMSRV